MNRIAKTALALVLAAGLTVAGPGSALAGGIGLGAGKVTKTQGGGVGCCVGAV